MKSTEHDPRNIIELDDVVKVYATAAGEFAALQGITLQVARGEYLGIVGRSGAGKSTLLNMVSGVDRLSSGQVRVRANGAVVSVGSLTEDEVSRWRGQALGIVYQSFQLLPMLTLIENVTLPMDLSGNFNPRGSRQRAMDLLRLVELEDHADKLPSQISGGQQQRVAIARAMANDPPILIADEPTGSLDSVTADVVLGIFERLVSDHAKTIVMVTHDHTLVERFSRHVILADGKLAGNDRNLRLDAVAPGLDMEPRVR
jgi:putative ABC transport system ATP-binding protein